MLPATRICPSRGDPACSDSGSARNSEATPSVPPAGTASCTSDALRPIRRTPALPDRGASCRPVPRGNILSSAVLPSITAPSFVGSDTLSVPLLYNIEGCSAIRFRVVNRKSLQPSKFFIDCSIERNAVSDASCVICPTSASSSGERFPVGMSELYCVGSKPQRRKTQ